MPRKCFVSKKPSPQPPPQSPPATKEKVPDKAAVIDKVILYAVFLVFKLINYLTRLLPKAKIPHSNINEDNCVQIQTKNDSIISISLPNNFESAIKGYGVLQEEVQYLKKVNSDLKKKFRSTKQDYIKCMKNLETANAQIYRLKNSNPLTCKNCDATNEEARSKICKAVEQILIKFEHLRLKCQYGIGDLQKACSAKTQSSHVKDIAEYHVLSLQQFIQWINMKMDNIQKFDHYVRYQTSHENLADILNHTDLNEVISTMHTGIMHFFRKYFVLLMVTMSDKEYIESTIHAQRKNPADTRQGKVDVTKENSTQTNSEKAKPQRKADVGNEQVTDSDFLQKTGRYHNLFIFLLDYLDFEPRTLIDCMLKVKKNNNNTFHNLTVFDIANKVEEAYRQMGCILRSAASQMLLFLIYFGIISLFVR